ncbi:MAG: histidine phosphatase family protein [Methylococcaceae bacterium]|nr:histidine phosphatase family protein [Methylococcaceae bacterium]
MMRELFILRHGKADTPEGLADFDRPLKKRGREDSKWIGRWLHDRKLLPDYVLSSPAIRALQTAQRVCKQLDFDLEAIEYEHGIYEAYPDTLVSVLKKCPHSAQRVLLVGHNPGLEGLIVKLTGYSEPLPDDASRLSPAAMVQLVFEGDWDQLTEGCAKWVALVRPENL